MKIVVAGGDGFCGWPTALHLSARGHQVTIVDNLVRREIDVELGSNSMTPILSLTERVAAWKEVSGHDIDVRIASLTDYEAISGIIAEIQPEALVHFAEHRSAPYSMIDREHAIENHRNNVEGTLNVLWAIKDHAPDCHLVKLGTMGEYGQPNIDIEEGWIEIEHKGRKDRLPFPKAPGSFYHLTKVHDSDNIMFACRIWGIRATDLNQGVVYGLETTETRLDRRLVNRFDYDAVFGTALNRFLIQAAIGHDLTVYGNGTQTRGYLDIQDTVRCIEIACENPADRGEFRVYNQFTEQFSVNELAAKVQAAGRAMGLDVQIAETENPRVEKYDHYYNAVHTRLLDLGLQPHLLTQEHLAEILKIAMENTERVRRELVLPTVTWK
ncbi:NAD-dependent epimerase/dehydratase family protein [Brachybacterium hainanense]|uniref:NAD-dependent epimerase/dehydratase family protein n=1 Tax=Brachybacterium hainanense TaxID=1541174 RepID=A0ABV6RH09_9MICO